MAAESKDKIPKKKVLIVPPGLKERYETFIDHYKVADGAPILILGPTGVGKTLFYEIYKSLFLKDNPSVTEDKIVRANCAHFGNQESDPHIARSELFGTDKNLIATYKVKQGLIEKAKGGVLFLEEIGELPIAVQAMLLTFIEDKKFKQVGGVKEKPSDCRIVAATNNEGTLREDFKNRFFPFSLPPIYERRNDVLYYLYEKYPDLLVSLTKNEILDLLSYNWLGNVREIERKALLMLRTLIKRNRLAQKPEKKEFAQELKLEGDWWKVFKTIEIDFGGSSRHKNINLYVELKKIGADIEYLEFLMKKYGLSFKGSYNDPDGYPFKNIEFDRPKYKEEELNEYTIKIYEEYPSFEKAYEGFLLFCSLFLQNHLDNKNVLKDLTECYPNFTLTPGVHFNKSDNSKLNKLLKKIFYFLSEIELDKSDKWPNDYTSLTKFLEQQAKSHSENRFLSNMLPDSHNDKKIPDDIINQMASFTLKKLLTAYYKKNLELTHGNVKAASERIGIAPSTLDGRLEKLGIKKKE